MGWIVTQSHDNSCRLGVNGNWGTKLAASGAPAKGLGAGESREPESETNSLLIQRNEFAYFTVRWLRKMPP